MYTSITCSSWHLENFYGLKPSRRCVSGPRKAMFVSEESNKKFETLLLVALLYFCVD